MIRSRHKTCHCSDRQQTQQQTLVNKYKNDAFWKLSSLNRLLLNTLQEKGNASQMALLSSPNELSVSVFLLWTDTSTHTHCARAGWCAAPCESFSPRASPSRSSPALTISSQTDSLCATCRAVYLTSAPVPRSISGHEALERLKISHYSPHSRSMKPRRAHSQGGSRCLS